MALDPTGQPTGWGLGAIGTPSVSTMPLAPRPTMQFTPEQIAQMRKDAMALQTPPAQGIHHWTQGLAELVRAIQGNREADFARQQELSGRQQGAEAIGQIYAPYLSPGGGSPASPSAAGAAPAGTLGSGPAGAMPSSETTPPAPTAGTTTADASAPRGIRNNNPLNIEDGPFAQSQPGYAGSDGRFAKFESSDHGVTAANSLLDIYGTKHGLNTVAGIVGRWAPSTDGNNTKAYAADVAAQLGIGPNDPIPPEKRPQLIAAMAKHENGVPFPAPAAQPAPTGLLAPIVPPAPASPPVPAAATPTVPANQASTAPPTRLAYAGPGPIPPGMLPSAITQGGQVPRPRSVFDTGVAPIVPSPMSPLVNAIAGRTPVPPPTATMDDFVKQASTLAAGRGPAVPLPTVSQPPADFATQLAALTADRGPSVPLSPAQGAAVMPPPAGAPPPLAIPPLPPSAAAPPAAVPPPVSAAPVPVPTPRPTVPLPNGAAIPGAVGPTSVGGTPLVPPATAALPPPVGSTSVNGAQLPQSGAPNAALASAIAGRPTPVSLPAGAPNPSAPIQVAQNGLPTSAAPMAPGAPSGGLPSPLTSPTGQVTQQQLTQFLANPWVPEQTKAAMLQMIQQRGQPQSMPVEGGTLMYNAAGQKVFIPEPKFGQVKIGSAEVPTVSHFDPATGRWNTTTLAPGGGVQTTPGGGPPGAHPAQAQGGTKEPDLSTIGGIQANEAAQAGAKKLAEEGATTSAKYYDAVHRGLAGSGMIAAQQKQNIDALRQIASSPDFISGTFANSGLAIQRLAAGLGINPTGAAPRELFNQLAAKVLADQFSGLKSMASETGEAGGRIFKPMLDIEEKANITPDDTAAGIGAKLNLLDNAGNLMMRYADLADDYIKEHGHLDAGFDKAIRKEIGSSRMPNIVPQAAAPAPSQSDIEAEMRRRNLLPPAGPPATPVSR